MTGALLGMDVRIAAPEERWPDPDVRELAGRLAAALRAPGSRLGDRPAELVEGADFVYTDVWVSMGEPVSAWGDRIALLRPFQVTSELMDGTGNPDARFLHCLPALHSTGTDLGRTILRRRGAWRPWR